jgi:N-acetyl-alpha-D-glucosaminyl L-malate synthase BshA
MRIALLCHASLGGSSRVATRLAYGLERRGHSVSLVSAAPPPAPTKELSAIRLELFGARKQSGWTTVVEPMWDMLRLAALERHIEAIVLRDGIEVVHYHYAWPFAHIVRRLKARLGPASPLFVGTLHGTDVMHAPDDGGLGALRDTDLLTTVSEAYAELAQARLDLDDAPLVIPNFVDLDDFPRSVDFEEAASGRRMPRLVHVSNVRTVKNPEGVARVFVALRAQIPAELWLVGEGPGLAELTSAIDRAGVGSDVRVLGYRSDIGQTLAQCDLLLMTSWEESFCLAALEAMACGLCVVATSVGGLTEVVEHGRTAMLFEPGDYEEAVRLAHRLLTERDLRLEIRRRAAERACDFSARAVVERYEAVYQLGCVQLRQPDELVAGEVF